jgi:NDP-sugar pyrophosphorylase family protein
VTSLAYVRHPNEAPMIKTLEITNQLLQCLLPLANTPLIEYTLEFLANAGVEEVFLYGGAHSDQLEKYIK